MPRIRLIHWKKEECGPKAAVLKRLGYQVDAGPLEPSNRDDLFDNPPAAIVLDLSRLPAQGREVGVTLRARKATRLVPLVFVEGDADKVERVKSTIPDARYTTYSKIGPVLDDVIRNPPKEVFVPKSLSGPDSPVPLVKKLGVKPGLPLGLIDAPEGFESLLPGVECKRNPRGKVPLTLWFVESKAGYRAALPKMRQRAADGGIWVVWPKQTKTRKPDLNGNDVRILALEQGLVDFKICAVDETWSGMRFAVRR